MADRVYSVKHNRLHKALLQGLTLEDDGGVKLLKKDQAGENIHTHTMFLQAIDCGEFSGEWGRFSFRADHDSDTAVIVYAVAVDNLELELEEGNYVGLDTFLGDSRVDYARKLRKMQELGGVRSVNHEDVLLYSQTGRYLFLAIEVIGNGDISLHDFVVHTQGDNFMQTFPEIYRERNSFFHRFMSVFSGIYADFEDEIRDLPRLLDIDTCPAELLPIYASWLGIDLTGGFLPDEVCRDLVREGYQLSKRKGTRWALQRIIEIVMGCETEVVEHNTMRGYLINDGAQIPANLRGGGIYDVTILVRGQIDETLRHQLMFLLDQFKPVRTKIRLVQLSDSSETDGNTYLDLNAALPMAQVPVLDENSAFGDVLRLE